MAFPGMDEGDCWEDGIESPFIDTHPRILA